jgi:hypothetical protein
MAGFAKRISISLAERFATTWVLLSDTTNFLSRSSIFAHYEGQLRELRQRLAIAKDDDLKLREAREELVALRASLRLQGYDLSLGSLDLTVKGFRNDAALSEGFKRIVVFIGAKDLWYITGDDNHRVLHDYLESDCDKRGINSILHKHYLWYRWNNGLLILSGADSERGDDFELLKEWAERPENRFAILSKLKKAR